MVGLCCSYCESTPEKAQSLMWCAISNVGKFKFKYKNSLLPGGYHVGGIPLVCHFQIFPSKRGQHIPYPVLQK